VGKAGSAGFFAPERWARSDGSDEEVEGMHEISLNPDTLMDEPPVVASVLVHEMVHLWQREHGTPSRRGYHNREWSEKMEAVGLIPSETGAPGGRKTGERMSHYIGSGGRFEGAFAALPEKHLLPWRSHGHRRAKRIDPSKAKYACPACGISVWGKLGLRLGCLSCPAAMVAV
jgi:hypothetical protein